MFSRVKGLTGRKTPDKNCLSGPPVPSPDGRSAQTKNRGLTVVYPSPRPPERCRSSPSERDITPGTEVARTFLFMFTLTVSPFVIPFGHRCSHLPRPPGDGGRRHPCRSCTRSHKDGEDVRVETQKTTVDWRFPWSGGEEGKDQGLLYPLQRQ